MTGIRAAAPPNGCVTIREAARQLGLTPKTVRNLLSKHRSRFTRVRWRDGRHPRRRRLLTRADVALLNDLRVSAG